MDYGENRGAAGMIAVVVLVGLTLLLVGGLFAGLVQTLASV